MPKPALHRRYGYKGRRLHRLHQEDATRYPIRSIEGVWGNDNPMWVTPLINDDSIHQAAADLAKVLSRGGEITFVGPDEIQASNWQDPDYHHAEFTWSGDVQDMQLLRRVAVMWVLGYELSTVAAALSSYSGLSWQVEQQLVPA